MQKSSQEHRSGQSGTTEIYLHTIGALSCEYHDSVVIVLELNHLQNFVYVVILKVKNEKVAIPCAVCVCWCKWQRESWLQSVFTGRERLTFQE